MTPTRKSLRRSHKARDITYKSLAEDESSCKARNDIWIDGYMRKDGRYVYGYCRRR